MVDVASFFTSDLMALKASSSMFFFRYAFMACSAESFDSGTFVHKHRAYDKLLGRGTSRTLKAFICEGLSPSAILLVMSISSKAGPNICASLRRESVFITFVMLLRHTELRVEHVARAQRLWFCRTICIEHAGHSVVQAHSNSPAFLFGSTALFKTRSSAYRILPGNWWRATESAAP